MMAILAMPAVIVGLVGALGMGIFWVQDHFEDRGFKNQIATLELKIDNVIKAQAGLELALQAERQNAKDLQVKLNDQSAKVVAAQREARRMESEANLRVARAVQAGDAAARALREASSHIPPGHEDMNRWVQMRIGVGI